MRDYLLVKYPEINRERLSVRGYGSSKAIAPNTTESGRAANRRVEIVATNRDELLRLIRGETAPKPDSLPVPDAPPDSLPAPEKPPGGGGK